MRIRARVAMEPRPERIQRSPKPGARQRSDGKKNTERWRRRGRRCDKKYEISTASRRKKSWRCNSKTMTLVGSGGREKHPPSWRRRLKQQRTRRMILQASYPSPFEKWRVKFRKRPKIAAQCNLVKTYHFAYANSYPVMSERWRLKSPKCQPNWFRKLVKSASSSDLCR